MTVSMPPPPKNPITQPDSVLRFVRSESANEVGSPNMNASGESEREVSANLCIPGGPENSHLSKDLEMEANAITNDL